MLSYLKESTVGDFSIVHFDVSETDASFFNLRNAMHGHRNRNIVAGRYTKLTQNGTLWMSDTPAEKRDHWVLKNMLDKANQEDMTGTVIMFGLGIGLATQMVVEAGFKCKVIELNKDVISLVGSQLLKAYPDMIEIVNDDALTYMPDKEYVIGWYDIWATITSDNWDEYQTFYERWRPYTKYQSAWAESEIIIEMADSCGTCDGSTVCQYCSYDDEYDDEGVDNGCEYCDGGICTDCEDGLDADTVLSPEFKL